MVDHPLISRFKELLGAEETAALLSALRKPQVQCIRVNELKTTIDEVKMRLEKHAVDLEKLQDIPYGFRVHGRASIGGLHEYLFGYYFIQAMASMLPPIALDPQPGEIILDMAAAPGGKTTHIAQLMRNTGVVVAIENNANKIPILESHIWRLGISNTVVLKGDARDLNRSTMGFDRILLDAPCTGEGGATDPQLSPKKTHTDVAYCTQVQSQLLDAAIHVLNPGGVLIYSTCSIHPEENECVVDGLLRRFPHLKLLDLQLKTGIPGFQSAFGQEFLEDLKKTRRWFPHLHQTIGFFIAKIKKGKNVEKLGGGEA